MKAAAFDYRCPADLDETVRLLAEGEGRAKIMAGGQSIGPMLNLRLTRPQLVLDLARVPGLEQVRSVGGQIEIGAGITHAAVEDGLHAALRGHPMQQIATGIAYRAVRNRGTLGGSLAHADPAADWVVTLTALGAELVLRSTAGERTVAMDGFMEAAYTTRLGTDEVIVAVRVPQAQGGRWGYHKFCRKPGEFAEASAAVWWAAGGSTPRIALGALDGAPVLLDRFAQQLARDGAACATREQMALAVQAALPGRALVDRQWHTVSLARAMAAAGLAAPSATASEDKTCIR